MNTLDTDTLIDLCHRGVVPVSNWRDRDTPGAQSQLAVAGAYLASGCEWNLAASPKSDKRTIWIEITHPTFGTFDWGEANDDELFYIPTEERLTEANGKDWH